MAKKKTEETKVDAFDLKEALIDCPKPEWYKRAFVKVMDTTKIKSENDLKKSMKEFGGMK